MPLPMHVVMFWIMLPVRMIQFKQWCSSFFSIWQGWWWPDAYQTPREALAVGLRMDLQVDSVCNSNPDHGLHLLWAIQCDNSLGKSL